MKGTLLLRPDKAGDALKTLPVLRALRGEGIGAPLHLLVSTHNASLFEHEPGIQLHVLPTHWREVPKDQWLSELGLRSLFPQFERVVNLLCDASEDADLLLGAIPAKTRYSAKLFDASADWAHTVHLLDLPEETPAGRSETENIALLLSQVFITDLVASYSRYSAAPLFSQEDHLEAQEKMGVKNGQWLGICPFAGLTQRTLPLARWRKFLHTVTAEERFSKFFLLGTASDFNRLNEIRDAAIHPEKVEIVYPSSFRVLGSYLSRLDGVVAVDSGPLHLARALGIRSLGILSGGDVARWFSPLPPGDHLLPRGWLQRYPSAAEMLRAFTQWKTSGSLSLASN